MKDRSKPSKLRLIRTAYRLTKSSYKQKRNYYQLGRVDSVKAVLNEYIAKGQKQ